MLGTVVVITTMDTSIFEAFPNAIISGVWEIGLCQHGTLIGNQYIKINDLDVVVDEGSNSSIDTTPETLKSNMLIYVYPDQLPTIQSNALVSAYMLYNSEENAYYEIVDAGIGKNQNTGNIEHVELMVVQTEVIDGEDSES